MPDDTMSKSVVSRVAVVVKKAYCMHSKWARQIDSYNPPDEKYGKYWTNTAIMCITNRIHPAEYIEVLFYALKPRWPEIRTIASAWALEKYQKYARPYAHKYLTDFTIQLHAFEQLVGQGRSPESVLLDDEQEFDPLFIYAVADSNDLPALAQKYKEAAFARYLTSVHYDQVYKDAIPASFKQQATELREGANAQRVD